MYATTLSLFVAFSSVWYGYTVYSALAALPIISERRNRMARKVSDFNHELTQQVAFLAVAMFIIFLVRSLNIILSFWAFKAELQLFLLSSIGLVLSELVPSYVLFALLLPEPKRKPIMPVGQEVMDYGSTPSHSYH